MRVEDADREAEVVAADLEFAADLLALVARVVANTSYSRSRRDSVVITRESPSSRDRNRINSLPTVGSTGGVPRRRPGWAGFDARAYLPPRPPPELTVSVRLVALPAASDTVSVTS